uniref:Variant surface glycoprotein 1016 n=1 Tax=Trypanosoma brucei TaxID=5691 RepID=M4TAK8_9TRYP|nr:variant surface glycoprotein 1016 [Trypanosoma brucei]
MPLGCALLWNFATLGWLATSARYGQAAAGDTVADFTALCHVYQAAMRLAAAAPAVISVAEDLAAIDNMNMSAADATWQTLFDAADAENNFAGYLKKNEGAKGKFDWSEQWAGWKQARQATKKPNQNWNKDNHIAQKKEQLQRLREFINATASEARVFANEAEDKTEPTRARLAQQIKTKVEEALCSTQTPLKTGKLTCTSPPTNIEKQNACVPANLGVGVLTDILCLCFTASGNECTGNVVTEFAAKAQTFVANTVEGIIAQCGQASATGDAETQLAVALAAFTARLGAGEKTDATHKLVLGKTLTTNCQATNSACLDYTQRVTGETKGPTAITWYSKLTEALKLHKQLQRANIDAAQAAKNLHILKMSLERELFKPLNIQQSGVPNTNGKEAPGSAKSNLEEQRSKCDANHGNKTECENLQCTYDENAADGKKCKPKAGEGETNAATGEAPKEAAAALTGCARHGNKAECDADKKDDKQNCAWRKGKEGEDDKDKEKCRNGVFLVNKKSV